VRKQGAGVRGLGAGGRSLHQALEDLVEYLQNLRAAGLLPKSPPTVLPAPQPAFPHHEALLSSRSLFVVEVEGNTRWTMRTLGRGAAALFEHAPWGDMAGQSLANLVRCEDIPSLVQIWNPQTSAASKGGGQEAPGGPDGCLCRLHVVTFAPSQRSSPAVVSHASSSRMADSAYVGGDAMDDDDFPEVSCGSWQYTPVFVKQLIPLQPGDSSSRQHRAPRALLIASLGAPCAASALPPCAMCDGWGCFRTEMNTPLEVAVSRRVAHQILLPAKYYCHTARGCGESAVALPSSASNIIACQILLPEK